MTKLVGNKLLKGHIRLRNVPFILPEFQLVSKITASNSAENDKFGIAVAISEDGNVIAIGASDISQPPSTANRVYIYTRSPTGWVETDIIEASDRTTSDGFGISVDVSPDGNIIIVGATNVLAFPTPPPGANAAYIFTRSGNSWTEQAKLVNSDIAGNNGFGISVKLSSDGNTAIIGAFKDGTYGANAGAAYIFVRSGITWSEQAKIELPRLDGAADLFGFSVSISSNGNTAIIGSPKGSTFNTFGAPNYGTAYIYTRSGSTWSMQQMLSNPNLQEFAEFGNSVDISSDGNTVIVGEKFAEFGAPTATVGAVHIFTRSGTTWSHQIEILNPDPNDFENFGHSVAISSDGNTVIIGAMGDVDSGISIGAAYIYTRSGIVWTQQNKIIPVGGMDGDLFGRAVAISTVGNMVVAGAPATTNIDFFAGAAYTFPIA